MKNNKFGFEDVRNLNAKSREKIVHRQILAVEEFVAKSRGKNPYFSWSHAPWPVQFLPVMTKFYQELGKINAVNPSLSGFSGLMGISKVEINKRLNNAFRPRNLFLEKLPKSREILEQEFTKKHNSTIKFPIILKPSVGERCSGVNFIREEQLPKFLQKNSTLTNIILEEFVETTQEFGLSWIRNPDDGKIEIIAFTERNTPKVLGDGQTSLQTLVDQKCQALSITKDRQEKIFAGFSAEELAEKIVGSKNIVRTASIAYGTVLKKINLTEKQKLILAKLVQKMIKKIDGIYVGRFDLKANNLDELLQGKCFILEMNGVAGAPLDIYDDEISIAGKYKILFDYFPRVLEIAEKNIANGEGEAISKIEGFKNISKLLFGKNKTQELPENVWENLKEVFKISLKGRFLASDLGKALDKFIN